MTYRTALVASIAAFACTAIMAADAAAQMMGNGPYSFPARNPSFAAQAHITERLNSNGGAASGMDALTQYVIQSTSIGNYNNIHVGDNATATVNSDQGNHGNQGADSSQTTNANKTVNKSPPGAQ